MPRYRHATWHPVTRYLPGGTSGGEMPHPTRLILHTAVSPASSLFDLFNTPGNPVAHFYVTADGHVEQYVDTGREASAVLNGNYNAITVETQDEGGPFPAWTGSNVPAWTDAQLDALARLALWCKRTHGIPLKLLLTSAAGHAGVGWHRLGVNSSPPFQTGYRQQGDELWSLSTGKACPGDRRIAQVPEVLRRARALEQSGTPSEQPPVVVKDQGRVADALASVHQARQAMKDSPRRDKLGRVAALLRRVLGTTKGKR